MTILGIGLDIVELERIGRLHRRHGDAFVDRICRPGECQPRRGAALVEHLGGLFAAKEAVLKALGTGWAQGLGLAQAEVIRNSAGAPGIRLHDAAAERAETLGVDRIHLSISHERSYASAVAILEGAAGASPGSTS
ncbi:MAG: holo-ACP synthase [Acidobacteriota bacterium]